MNFKITFASFTRRRCLAMFTLSQWALKQKADGDADGSDARHKARRIATSDGDQQSKMLQLVLLLTKLSLANAQGLRDLCAVVFHTFIIPTSSLIFTQMKEMGRACHTRSQEIAKIEDLAQKESEVQKQGAPYVHMWVALLLGIGKAEGDQALKGEELKKVQKYWQEQISAKPTLDELVNDVKHCKIKETKKKESKQETARLPIAFDPSKADLEEVLLKAIRLQGGVKKHGAAPRGPLEREAQKLLDHFMKGQ